MVTPHGGKMTFERRKFGLMALAGAAILFATGRQFLAETDSIGDADTDSLLVGVGASGDWYTDNEGRALLWA
jgi:hypothetical protein